MKTTDYLTNFPLPIEDQFTIAPLEAKHADELFNLIEKNRSILRQWLGWLDRTQSVKDSTSFIEYSMKKNMEMSGLILGIFEADKLIGMIDFHSLDISEAGIGYWLDKDCQGRGIITKACFALIDFGFNELGIQKVAISCAQGNSKSSAVPLRLNLKLERSIENKEFLYDHYVNHDVYTINKKDWERQRLVFHPKFFQTLKLLSESRARNAPTLSSS